MFPVAAAMKAAWTQSPATLPGTALGCQYLLVLTNTEVFFILPKNSLLHMPWVAGVRAQVTTTKSDSSASLVSGTEGRNGDIPLQPAPSTTPAAVPPVLPGPLSPWGQPSPPSAPLR